MTRKIFTHHAAASINNLANAHINQPIQRELSLIRSSEWLQLIDVRLTCLFAILFALCTWRDEFVMAALAGCVLLSFLSAENAIKALSTMIILKFLNKELLTFGGADAALAWAILLIASVRVIPLYIFTSLRAVRWLLVYCAIVAILIPLVSRAPLISGMKLLSFFLSAATILIGFRAINAQSTVRLQRWIFSIFIALLVLSLPLYAIPEIGYSINGRGFQGMLNQPQALAIVIAPFAAWMVASLFLRKRNRIDALSCIGLIVILGVLISTKARTAALAVVLGNLSTVIIILISSRYRYHALSSGKKLISGLAIGSALMAIGLIASGDIAKVAHQYLLKGESESVEDAFYHSRGANIKTQWENFLKSPLIGHGFGIYPGGVAPNKVVYFMGIPISASTEKGFMPTAALEETGLIGVSLLLVLLASLARQVYRQYDPRWMAMYFSCLFVNCGEAVFFSAGGLGLFFWILIGLSTRGSNWRRIPCAT